MDAVICTFGLFNFFSGFMLETLSKCQNVIPYQFRDKSKARKVWPDNSGNFVLENAIPVRKY